MRPVPNVWQSVEKLFRSPLRWSDNPSLRSRTGLTTGFAQGRLYDALSREEREEIVSEGRSNVDQDSGDLSRPQLRYKTPGNPDGPDCTLRFPTAYRVSHLAIAIALVARRRWLRAAIIQGYGLPAPPWHFLNFLPLPHGHGALRPTLPASRTFTLAALPLWQAAQVHASGWRSYQLGLFMAPRKVRRPLARAANVRALFY